MPGYVSLETATFEDLGDKTRFSTTAIFHRPMGGSTKCSPAPAPVRAGDRAEDSA